MSTVTQTPATGSATGTPGLRERLVRSDRRLSAITLLLRLPQVMSPLGVLTTVAYSTSSAWSAGLSSAALCLGMAVCAVGLALFSNVRWLQWALIGMALIQGGVMWQLSRVNVSTVPVSWEAVSAFLPFFIAGLSLAPMGLAARLRWASVLAGQGRLQAFSTAMRRESVNEALATVLGAALTGLLAVLLGPSTVLQVSAVLSVVMMVVFVAHRSARYPQANVPVHLFWHDLTGLSSAGSTAQDSVVLQGSDMFDEPSARRAASAPRITTARLRLGLLYGIAALNALLGAVQGCLAVYTVSLDSVETMGAIYALLGVGAAVGSILAVRFRHHITASNLMVLAGTGALLTSMLLSAPSGTFGYTGVLMLVGLFSGPSLLCLHSCAGQVGVTKGFMGLVAQMSVVSNVSTAVGLIICAHLGAHRDYMSAAMVPVAAAMLLLGTALFFSHTRRRSTVRDPRI